MSRNISKRNLKMNSFISGLLMSLNFISGKKNIDSGDDFFHSSRRAEKDNFRDYVGNYVRLNRRSRDLAGESNQTAYMELSSTSFHKIHGELVVYKAKEVSVHKYHKY